MPSYYMMISDADAEASRVLGRMRLDGLDQVAVPFEQRLVQAWRRGVPEPGMDVDTLISILQVRALPL